MEKTIEIPTSNTPNDSIFLTILRGETRRDRNVHYFTPPETKDAMGLDSFIGITGLSEDQIADGRSKLEIAQEAVKSGSARILVEAITGLPIPEKVQKRWQALEEDVLTLLPKGKKWKYVLFIEQIARTVKPDGEQIQSSSPEARAFRQEFSKQLATLRRNLVGVYLNHELLGQLNLSEVFIKVLKGLPVLLMRFLHEIVEEGEAMPARIKQRAMEIIEDPADRLKVLNRLAQFLVNINELATSEVIWSPTEPDLKSVINAVLYSFISDQSLNIVTIVCPPYRITRRALSDGKMVVTFVKGVEENGPGFIGDGVIRKLPRLVDVIRDLIPQGIGLGIFYADVEAYQEDVLRHNGLSQDGLLGAIDNAVDAFNGSFPYGEARKFLEAMRIRGDEFNAIRNIFDDKAFRLERSGNLPTDGRIWAAVSFVAMAKGVGLFVEGASVGVARSMYNMMLAKLIRTIMDDSEMTNYPDSSQGLFEDIMQIPFLRHTINRVIEEVQRREKKGERLSLEEIYKIIMNTGHGVPVLGLKIDYEGA